MIARTMLLTAIFLFHIAAKTQTKKINDLKAKVDAAKSNDEKLKAIVVYCEDYSNVAHDSLEKYAYVALELAEKSKDEKLKSLAWLTLAQDYMEWGWTDSVHVVVDEELKKNLSSDDKRRDIYFRLKKLKAVAYGSEGRLKESLEILYPLEIESEKYKDSLLTMGLCNMIGSIASSRNELIEARKWNDKAISFSNTNNAQYIGSVYITRAQILYRANKTDSALYFLEKGISLCKKIEMNDRLASAYRFQSAIYTDINKLEEAETALKNMQLARSKIRNNPDAIIEDNLQVADFYANTGQLKKAIAFCWSKLDSGNYYIKSDAPKTFNNDPAARLPFYLALAGYLKQDKNAGDYEKVLEEIIVLKDTMAKINKTEAIAELQTKYDVEEKENTIISQQLKLTQRNYLLYGSLIFIVLAGIISWLWLRIERSKQTLKTKQAIDDAEEKERKRIAADLHDNIGAYAFAISAEVENMAYKGIGDKKQLQNLQLHSKEIMHSLSDTIWVLNKENITITGISYRIKHYINKLKPTYEHINIEVNESILNDVYVGSEKALNIFRIVQESIHNALKHSNAKNILLYIISNENISITIKDDGKGIINKAANGGNGLRNMKARALDAEIKFSVESSVNNGTAVFLNTAMQSYNTP